MEDKEIYEQWMASNRPFEPQTLFHQLRCPTINKEYIMEVLRLPDNFLGFATLREGTVVTLLWLQTVAVLFSGYLTCYLVFWHDYGDMIWRQKFTRDFDPYLEGANADFIDSLWTCWPTVVTALVGTHVAYFICGLGVIIGLCNRHGNPLVYIPWLIMTAFLVGVTFLTSFLMLIMIGVLMRYRSISVTWDICPMICVFLYGIAWSYGFFIVLAYYKRRRIVQFWRQHKRNYIFDLN